ncbi:MAG: hypothetical protein ACR5LD_00455 [Symbiopectobacterium sp.]
MRCMAASMCELENDVYFKVELLTTMGLSAKNDIIKEGKGLVEADA